MKNINFTDGVIAAALIAAIGAVSFAAFSLIWPAALALKLVIAASGAGYVSFIVKRSNIRYGRVTLPLAWLSAAAAIALWAPSLLAFVALHTALLWISRALCRHSSILSALIDLAVCGAALLGAILSVLHSGSPGLGLWCFFLVQALFTFIPRSWNRPDTASKDHPTARFERAYNQAQSALRRVTNPV